MQRQVGHYIISYYVPSALLVGSLNRHLIHHPMWRNIRWTIQVFKELLCTYTYVSMCLWNYIHPGVYEHGELLVGAKCSAWSGDFGHLHLAHSHHSHSEVNFSNKQTWTHTVFKQPNKQNTSTWLTLTQRWTSQIENKHEHIIISWLTFIALIHQFSCYFFFLCNPWTYFSLLFSSTSISITISITISNTILNSISISI